MRPTIRRAAAGIFGGVLAAAGAAAQNVPDEYLSRADEGTEYQVFEEAGIEPDPRGLPQIRHDFADGGFVRLYGHVNWGLLYVDDGKDTEVYVPLDNGNSVSRLGAILELPLADDWLLSGRVEAGYAPYGTGRVNLLNDEVDWEFTENNIRWIDLNLSNPGYGGLSVGQGAMAFAGAMFVDFSDTGVIAGSAPEDSAFAQFLRPTDPDAAVDAGPIVGAAFRNFDGNRRVRVRYDTPRFYGFGASAAYGRNLLTTNSDEHDENLYDLSLTYGGEFGDFSLGAAGGYYWNSFDREAYGGSAAVLHRPTGLSLSAAGGGLQRGTGADATYGYVKLGLTRELFGFGRTAASVDYYNGSDIAAEGSDSQSVGVALVQFVDAFNTELWLTWRLYDYDERDRSFEDMHVVFGGFRFSF